MVDLLYVGVSEYYVPALLPMASGFLLGTYIMVIFASGYCHTVFNFTGDAWNRGKPYRTVRFWFSIHKHSDQNLITAEDMERYGYLPKGLYARIIARVAWNAIEQPLAMLSKNISLFFSDDHLFRLVVDERLKVLRVDFGSGDLQSLHQRLSDHVAQVVGFMMNCVNVTSWIASPDGHLDSYPWVEGDKELIGWRGGIIVNSIADGIATSRLSPFKYSQVSHLLHIYSTNITLRHGHRKLDVAYAMNGFQAA